MSETQTNPASLLLQETLDELNITNKEFADSIGIPASRVSEILNNKRMISQENALRIACYFNTSAQSWLNLQNKWTLKSKEEELKEELEKIKPIELPA